MDEDPLTRPVHIKGTNKAFGECTAEDAQAMAIELKSLSGWGPTARVGAIGRGWQELTNVMKRAEAANVAALDAETVQLWAERLYVVSPKGGLLWENPRDATGKQPGAQKQSDETTSG